MYKLEYFTNDTRLCESDFDNKVQTEYINLSEISSISQLKEFKLPFSGKFVGKYSIVSMKNRDNFVIKEAEYLKLLKEYGL